MRAKYEKILAKKFSIADIRLSKNPGSSASFEITKLVVAKPE